LPVDTKKYRQGSQWDSIVYWAHHSLREGWGCKAKHWT
jgi:hypothetical protein